MFTGLNPAYEDAWTSGYSFNNFNALGVNDTPNPINPPASKIITQPPIQSPQSNIDIALGIMRNRGFSDAQIAGVLGVLQAESDMDLTPGIRAKARGDTGVGIAQWTNNKEGKRHKIFWNVYGKLYNDADTYKGDITKVPFEKQLEVVLNERPDVMDLIKQQKTVDGAVDIMLRGFENGGGTAKRLASRELLDKVYGAKNNYAIQFDKRLRLAKALEQRFLTGIPHTAPASSTNIATSGYNITPNIKLKALDPAAYLYPSDSLALMSLGAREGDSAFENTDLAPWVAYQRDLARKNAELSSFDVLGGLTNPSYSAITDKLPSINPAPKVISKLKNRRIKRNSKPIKRASIENDKAALLASGWRPTIREFSEFLG